MNPIPEILEFEGHPVLDVKFRNAGRIDELLTRVVVDVSAAAVDLTPVLEYSLRCFDGDLHLVVRNHGWGPAEEFSGDVDLTAFGAGVPRSAGRIAPTSIDPGETRHFPLMFHRQLVLAHVPPEVVLDAEWLDRSRYRRTPAGGIDGLPGRLRYRSADGNGPVTSVFISARSRMPGRAKIFVIEGALYAFDDSPVGGFRRLQPSGLYHFMLDPEQGPRVYEHSVAHVLGPGEFDRIWLILAARKSGFFDFTCRFATSTATVAETGPMALHIWEPGAGRFRSHPSGGRRSSDITFPTGGRWTSRLRRYDPSRRGHRGGR